MCSRDSDDLSPTEQRRGTRPLRFFAGPEAESDSEQGNEGDGANNARSTLRPRYSSSIFSLSRNEVDRPPDWRWQRALRRAVDKTRFPRRSLDSVTRKATSFIAGLTGAKEGRIQLPARFMKDATVAWRLHQQPVLDSLRHTIELYILADMPQEQISRESGLSLTAVALYEELFWDIREKLDLPIYIHSSVVNFDLPDSETGRIAREVRALAYTGGSEVAKALLQRVELPDAKPTSAKEVDGCLRQSTLALVHVKACLAMRLLDPANRKDAKLLLRFHTALKQLERKQSKKFADPPWSREQQRAAIEAFKRTLPRNWGAASPSNRGTKPAQS